MHSYNTAQPRISIVSPGNQDGVQREMEVGQAAAWSEALFFARVCDYRINIARWNGQCFKDHQYLTRADLI